MCSEEPLSVTCCSNISRDLRWIVIFPERNVTMYHRVVSSSDNSILPSLPIKITNRTVTVNFLRQSTDPLISTLTINSTITELNGTEINCSTENASEMTVIHVINGNSIFMHA